MPTIDMSMKELEKYMGVNPKPADFEALSDVDDYTYQFFLKDKF